MIPPRNRALFGLVLASCAAIACATRPPAVTLENPQHPWTAANYYRALERWTRGESITILRELNTTLRVHATLFSPEFITAYVDKRRKLFKLPRREVRELVARLDKLWEESYPLVMITATHDARWNDFEERKSTWRVWLANNRGERVAPVSIVPRRRLGQTETTLFPHLDHFYHYYEVRFPRVLPDGRPLVRPDTSRLILFVTGPLGVARLVWRLQSS